jgi:hypothetical protein
MNMILFIHVQVGLNHPEFILILIQMDGSLTAVDLNLITKCDTLVILLETKLIYQCFCLVVFIFFAAACIFSVHI